MSHNQIPQHKSNRQFFGQYPIKKKFHPTKDRLPEIIEILTLLICSDPNLSEIERDILRGVLINNLSLDELGFEHKLTRERVRQLFKIAFIKVKEDIRGVFSKVVVLGERNKVLSSKIQFAMESLFLAVGVFCDEINKSPLLNLKIESMSLSVRTLNCLKFKGIKTIGDLMEYNSLMLLQIPNFGTVCLNEIKNKLASFGLSLK